jgi:hypothetical protein
MWNACLAAKRGSNAALTRTSASRARCQALPLGQFPRFGVQAERKAGSDARQQRGLDARSGLGYMMPEDVVPMASMRVYSRFSNDRRFGGAVKVRARFVHCVLGTAIGRLMLCV